MNTFNFPTNPHDGQTKGVSIVAMRKAGVYPGPVSELMKHIPEGWVWASGGCNGLRFIYRPKFSQ